MYSFLSFYFVHERLFKVENSELTEIEGFSEHFKSSVLFHSPYLTVCIRFYAVTGFVFWIVQEKGFMNALSSINLAFINPPLESGKQMFRIPFSRK